MTLWRCPRCHHDKLPEQFYCTTPPHETGAAWWCKLCVCQYVQRKKKDRFMALESDKQRDRQGEVWYN